MMAANAVRSAMHAAGLSLRGGREHAEETARAIHFATEAVRTALRMTRLDLPALAARSNQDRACFWSVDTTAPSK